MSCDKGRSEPDNIHLALKKEIDKMDLGKSNPNNSHKDTDRLRNKLMDVMNVLPSQSNDCSMYHFESSSEPYNEGTPGHLNSKLSCPKANRPPFSKASVEYLPMKANSVKRA